MQVYENLDFKSIKKKKRERMIQFLLNTFILLYEGQEQLESQPTEEAEEADYGENE